jgi:soluble cytochrome b562
MITKRPPTHIYDIHFKDTSYSLLERLKKYLGGADVEYLDEGYHLNENKNGFTVTTKEEIGGMVLDRISELLPKWVKEIKIAEAKEEADDLKEIKAWLKKFKLPKLPNKKALRELWDNIHNLHDEIVHDASKDVVTPCGLGDITDLLDLFKLLEKGKIEEAKKSLWEMDTGARDYIPDSCRRMMNYEDED